MSNYKIPAWQYWLAVHRVFTFGIVCFALLSCTSTPTDDTQQHVKNSQLSEIQLLNRITWGANSSSLDAIAKLKTKGFMMQQLHPQQAEHLPEPVATQIAIMKISKTSMVDLLKESELLRKQADQVGDETAKKAAHKNYQQFLTSLEQESAQRFILRAIYSPNQLQEQLTWFWLNHFSVYTRKNNIRAMIGDYEDQTIRPHVLGRFRDLLAATVYHPAMLTYLDNDKNVAGHINENYARELMELHTLGVNGGYSQSDVQELARVLTGLGVDRGEHSNSRVQARKNSHRNTSIYKENGVVFNLRKHDSGNKIFLGEKIDGTGKAEIDTVLDRISCHPATAHFISQKLAVYFMGDDPSPVVVEHMAQTFLSKDGDISATLKILFQSPEFNQSLGKSFKDPVHYVVSSLRLLYDKSPIISATPAISWLNTLGEPLYGHQTPDGYPLNQLSWSSPSQMTARFDVARIMGASTNGLLQVDSNGKNTVSSLQASHYSEIFHAQLSSATQQALAQAKSPQEWNVFFLSSPEFMNH